MTIWTHEICYCRYESGFTIQSVHSERGAAIRALLAAKRARVEERLGLRELYGKRRGDLYEVQPDFDAQAVRGMVVDGEKLQADWLCVNVPYRGYGMGRSD